MTQPSVTIQISHFNKSYKIPECISGDDGKSYYLGEEIGKGGNGVVLDCQESVSGEEYAVKILLENKGKKASRFDRELEAIQSVKHDHIIGYITHGEAASQGSRGGKGRARAATTCRFVVMEKAEQNLRQSLAKASAPPRFEKYASNLLGLADALVAIHGSVVHRDIKPENILVIGEQWLLSDFGLCAPTGPDEDGLTRADEPVGPRYWMSPEATAKAMGLADKLGPQSDLFQLAAVFWFIIVGRPPIGVVTTDDWSGPIGLGDLLLSTLQHDISRRPDSSVAFHSLLKDALLATPP